MAKQTEFPEIMSLHQAQKFLKLRYETVKELFETGVIPARPFGINRWKVFKGDLISYIRQGNQKEAHNEPNQD
jgi:hypothetical protein